jgi:hypothetical protein
MNTEKALDAYMTKIVEVREILGTLTELSDDHFGNHPDYVNWGDVGDIEATLASLRNLHDRWLGLGEYAS